MSAGYIGKILGLVNGWTTAQSHTYNDSKQQVTLPIFEWIEVLKISHPKGLYCFVLIIMAITALLLFNAIPVKIGKASKFFANYSVKFNDTKPLNTVSIVRYMGFGLFSLQ